MSKLSESSEREREREEEGEWEALSSTPPFCVGGDG